MERQAGTDNRGDIFELDNRKAVLIFFGFLAICCCFFVAGYVLGTRAARPPADYAGAGAAGNSAPEYDFDTENDSGMDEVISKPILPPSAVVDPPAESPESVVPGDVQHEPLETAASAAVKPQPVENTAAVTPVSSPAYVDKPRPQPKEAANSSAEKPASLKKPAVSSKDFYSVQIAAFRTRRLVEIKARELEARGFEPIIEPPQAAGDYYRLRVGRFVNRTEADRMSDRLKKNGFETMVVEVKGN